MQKWLGFWALAFIWGSSFALISVGVRETSFFQLVFIRTLIAAVGLNVVLALRGKHIPFDIRGLIPLFIIGVGNTTIPFALITWGEKTVASGLASVIQASVPMFSLVIAHFAFADERITRKKLIGVVVGFAGIVVLSGSSLLEGDLLNSGFLGQLAIIIASLCYASFGVYSRKQIQNRYEPLIVSAGSLTFAALTSGIGMILAPYFGGDAATPLNQISSDALWSILALGFFNTFVAYLIFYWVLQQLGAARGSMVTYVIPVVALTLGAVFLNEEMTPQMIFGAVLIFAGIAIVNVKWSKVMQIFRSQSAESVPIPNEKTT